MPSEISGPVFALEVGTDPDASVVRLRLTDEHDRQLGANQVRLADHGAALWQGLFHTRAYVRTYADSVRFTDRPATAADLLAQIGVFLGERSSAPRSLAALYAGKYQRSLLVRQPKAEDCWLTISMSEACRTGSCRRDAGAPRGPGRSVLAFLPLLPVVGGEAGRRGPG